MDRARVAGGHKLVGAVDLRPCHLRNGLMLETMHLWTSIVFASRTQGRNAASPAMHLFGFFAIVRLDHVNGHAQQRAPRECP